MVRGLLASASPAPPTPRSQRLDFLMTEELSNRPEQAAGSRVKPCAKLIFQQADNVLGPRCAAAEPGDKSSVKRRRAPIRASGHRGPSGLWRKPSDPFPTVKGARRPPTAQLGPGRTGTCPSLRRTRVHGRRVWPVGSQSPHLGVGPQSTPGGPQTMPTQAWTLRGPTAGSGLQARAACLLL